MSVCGSYSLFREMSHSERDSLLMLGTSASLMDTPLLTPRLLPPPSTAGTMPRP